MTTTSKLQADQRECPKCAAIIKRRAQQCKYCHHSLTAKEFRDANPVTEAEQKIRKWVIITCAVCAIVIVVVQTALPAMGIKLDSTGGKYPSHCASPWDGSIRQVAQHVKASMHDPGSFEHVETRLGETHYGFSTVVMTYRGRNGFGGVRTETATVTMKSSDCSVMG